MIVKITTTAKAETLAAEERNKAEEFATLSAKIRYEIDAAGKLKLNEAENSRNDASRTSEVRMQLARNLDSIIRESVKPMSSIDTIKIYEVNGLPGAGQNGAGHNGAQGGELYTPGPGNGGPSLADNVVTSALRYRAHMPFVDGLLGEIGMSSGEITNLGKIFGDNSKHGSREAERP